MSNLMCVECKAYVFHNPMQCPCGCRLCGTCYAKYKSRDKAVCPLCQTDFLLEDCFSDKAATKELEEVILKCKSSDCPWVGKSEDYEEHVQKCEYTPKSVTEMNGAAQCVYGNGQVTRKCNTPGCSWEGTDLAKYEKHIQTCLSQLPKSEINGSQMSMCVYKMGQENVQNEVEFELAQPMTGSVIQHVPSQVVQTVPNTSHNGKFIWKIPEVRRRTDEAKTDKTIFLYSIPFYTSRHGYKVCLRLYMDGDGSGKSTYLSFFLTVMKGEYDALLQWPFRQIFTLTLLDQDKVKDITQSFKPEPSSPSFQRPRNEMNVASGCPMFAPLSVLNNSSYVKDDTMFLKCKIDTAGIEE